jgi:hypothetical protein
VTLTNSDFDFMVGSQMVICGVLANACLVTTKMCEV